MELKEFIKTILSDIDGAFDELYKEKGITYSLGEEKGGVGFDIFVSLENSGTKTGGGQIKVLSVIDVGGKMESENKTSNSHRITFKAMEHGKPNHHGKMLTRGERPYEFYLNKAS